MFLVALTGYALPEDSRGLRRPDFQRHLAKPLSLQALERICSPRPNRRTGLRVGGRVVMGDSGRTRDIDLPLGLRSSPGRFLLLAPDRPQFTILAVTEALPACDHDRRRRDLRARPIEVFPDNPVSAVGRPVYLQLVGSCPPGYASAGKATLSGCPVERRRIFSTSCMDAALSTLVAHLSMEDSVSRARGGRAGMRASHPTGSVAG